MAGILEYVLPTLLGSSKEGATASSIDQGALFILGAGIGVVIAAYVDVVMTKNGALEEGLLAGYCAGAVAALPPYVVLAGFQPLPIIIGAVGVGMLLSLFAALGIGLGVATRRVTRRNHLVPNDQHSDARDADTRTR